MKRICCVIAKESQSIVYYWEENQGLVGKISPYSPYQVIDCLMKAQLRSMEETRMLLNQWQMYQKLPVYLGEEMIFFPTAGLQSANCNWIRYDFVRKVKKHPDGCSVVVYYRGYYATVFLPCSRETIQKQMKRCREIEKRIQAFDMHEKLSLD